MRETIRQKMQYAFLKVIPELVQGPKGDSEARKPTVREGVSGGG